MESIKEDEKIIKNSDDKTKQDNRKDLEKMVVPKVDNNNNQNVANIIDNNDGQQERFTKVNNLFDDSDEEEEDNSGNNNVGKDKNINNKSITPSIKPNKSSAKRTDSQISRIVKSAKNKLNYKIILLGDVSVGKTSIFNRFINNSFSPSSSDTTSIDNKQKSIVIDENTIACLSLWDTAGEEKFKGIAPLYYKDAHGALLIYDINDKKSFESLENWVTIINSNVPKDCIIQIVGNKSDTPDLREVSKEEIRLFADQNSLDSYEVSAKDGTNIAFVFEKLTYKIIERQKIEAKSKDKVLRKDGRQSYGLNDFQFRGAGSGKRKCCGV